jgi:hypothetical protein
MFVLCGRGANPSRVHYTWTAGDSYVYVPGDDPNSCTKQTDTTFAIAVQSNSPAGSSMSRFILSASSTAAGRTLLIPGVPAKTGLISNAYSYFEVMPVSDLHLLIATATEDGSDVYGYVSTTFRYPGPTHYTWAGPMNDGMWILNTDPHFCWNCTYYIAITAEEPKGNVELTVVASTEDRIITVLNGISMKFRLSSGQTLFFQQYLPVPVQKNFTLSLQQQASTGDVSVYMSCTYDPFPGPDQFTWKDDSAPGTPAYFLIPAPLPVCAQAPAMFFSLYAQQTSTNLLRVTHDMP